jgi:hypothetical protein
MVNEIAQRFYDPAPQLKKGRLVYSSFELYH